MECISCDGELSPGGTIHSSEDVQQGTLSRAWFAHDDDEFTSVDTQIHSSNCWNALQSKKISFVNILHLQNHWLRSIIRILFPTLWIRVWIMLRVKQSISVLSWWVLWRNASCQTLFSNSRDDFFAWRQRVAPHIRSFVHYGCLHFWFASFKKDNFS